MKAQLSPRLLNAALTALVWALLAGSALWWWLRASPAPAAPAAVAADTQAGVDGTQVAAALGANATASEAPAPAAPEVAGRLQLQGLVVQGGRGAALLSVDGQPARHARVGEAVPGLDGWQVQALTGRSVTLTGGSGAELKLEMPPQAERVSGG